jgi:hypothetical protein
MKKSGVLEVTVPLNFMASDFIPSRTTRKRELEDAMNFVVSQILVLMMSERGRDELTQTGFIQLHTGILDSLVGRAYKRAIDLLKNHVFEVRADFQPGKYSRGYRLFPQFLGSTKKVLLQTSLIKSRIQAAETIREASKKSLSTYSILYKWLKDERLKNNFISETQYYIESLKATLLRLAEEHVDSHQKNQLLLSELHYRIAARFFSQKFYLEQMETRKFEPTLDAKGGRLYHPLTSMFKGLRNFYQFENEPLTSLDIKTSQPYLFVSLLRREFWKKNKEKSLYSVKEELYQELVKRNSIVNIIKLWDSQEANSSGGWHLHSFANAVLSGDIYVTIAKTQHTFDESDEPARKRSREMGKRMMMWFMYGDFSRSRPPAYSRFTQAFPFESKLMENIKKGGHELFPIILQALEARIVLEKVISRVDFEFPGTPVYTIHDSVITIKSMADKVKTIMEEELESFVGAPPTISTEHLLPSAPLNSLENEATSIFQEMIKDVARQKRRLRPIGHFHFNTSTMSIPWKKVLPSWNGNKILSSRFLADEDESD